METTFRHLLPVFEHLALVTHRLEQAEQADLPPAQMLGYADEVTVARLAAIRALLEQGWTPPERLLPQIRVDREITELASGVAALI